MEARFNYYKAAPGVGSRRLQAGTISDEKNRVTASSALGLKSKQGCTSSG